MRDKIQESRDIARKVAHLSEPDEQLLDGLPGEEITGRLF